MLLLCVPHFVCVCCDAWGRTCRVPKCHNVIDAYSCQWSHTIPHIDSFSGGNAPGSVAMQQQRQGRTRRRASVHMDINNANVVGGRNAFKTFVGLEDSYSVFCREILSVNTTLFARKTPQGTFKAYIFKTYCASCSMFSFLLTVP